MHTIIRKTRIQAKGVVNLPFGLGPWGWFMFPYLYGAYYPYYWVYAWSPYWWWWRCRWFPWLPRWWWTGIYGPITPWTWYYY